MGFGRFRKRFGRKAKRGLNKIHKGGKKGANLVSDVSKKGMIGIAQGVAHVTGNKKNQSTFRKAQRDQHVRGLGKVLRPKSEKGKKRLGTFKKVGGGILKGSKVGVAFRVAALIKKGDVKGAALLAAKSLPVVAQATAAYETGKLLAKGDIKGGLMKSLEINPTTNMLKVVYVNGKTVQKAI